MKKRLLSLLCSLVLGSAFATATAFAQTGASVDPAAPAAQTTSGAQADAVAANNTKAAAAVASQQPKAPREPDFLEHLVDEILRLFDVRSSQNTVTHFVIACVFLVLALLARRIVTGVVFGVLKRFASRTQTTLDDKLFPALEAPVSTFIALVGIFSALAVLKLPTTTDTAISYGSTIAFSLVIFWALLRAFGALLDHGQEVAVRRHMSVAAFMPWIKKTLITIFVIFGVLMVVQSLGYDVKALLAGLGIGGLAFALAAQDTLANVFGSIVVAIDQPFKIGEFVRIGPFAGSVEDIGLRSTKLRAVDKSLIIIPNKTVAAEGITNQSRFTRRRAEQVIGLTYNTTAEQMEGIVNDFRRILEAEPYVDPASVLVFFRDYSASSLDVWVVYETRDADFQKHMHTRQKLNLAMMRAVESRGLSFAFPTQTVYLEGEAVRRIADRTPPPAARPTS